MNIKQPVACWSCKYFNQKSYMFTTGQKNVSGGVVWYRQYAKHRCDLEQEHLYPKQCGYVPTEKARKKYEKLEREAELLNI